MAKVQRKRATREDMKVGSWFWLEYHTFMNGEGGISAPAKVTQVTPKEIFFEVFGGGFGLERSNGIRSAKALIRDIVRKRAGVYLLDSDKLRTHILREQEWVETEMARLREYSRELLSAPV
ncbi:MAG: hypothetical protein HY457_01335 [Parcubacteria group bacterium]|nr:hypothetical protein [Parcubacteria group bacterium]